MFWAVIIGMTIVGIVIYWAVERPQDKIAKKYDEKSVKLYEECKASGITYSISDEKTREIKRIACNLGFAAIKSVKMYNRGYDLTKSNQQEDQKRKQRINWMIRNVGTKKYSQGLIDRLEDSYQFAANILEQSSGILSRNSTQVARTHNPATWGGIADGLAGSAAGVVTAINTQRQNELAEQKAAERRERATSALWETNSSLGKIKKAKEALLKEISAIDQSVEEIRVTNNHKIPFSVSVDEYHVRESGSLYMEVSIGNISTTQKQQIMDGLLHIQIRKKNKKIGYTCLGTYGYLSDFDVENGIASIQKIGFKSRANETWILTGFPLEEFQFAEGEEYSFEFSILGACMVDISKLETTYKSLCKSYKYNYESVKNHAVRNSTTNAFTTLNI